MATNTSTDDTPLTTDFRARLKRALHGALKTRNNTLIVAPTGLGKTHEVATTRWQDYPELIGTAGESSGPVIHISQSKKARDQAHDMSKAAGVRSHVLKGREDVCAVANGDFDDTLLVPNSRLPPSEWFNLKCDVQGIGFGKAHAELSRLLNGLPCSNAGDCKGYSQWWPISDDGASEIDIVHTTANFAFNPGLIENRVVVFDEQPHYTKSVRSQVSWKDEEHRVLQRHHLTEGITEFLKTHRPESAYNHWDALITAVTANDTAGIEEFREVVASAEIDDNWYLETPHLHVSTPALIEATLNSESVGNGYRRGQAEVTESDSEGVEVTHRTITMVLEEKNNYFKLISEPPDLSGARCVIGFDAHPTVSLWNANTVSDLVVDDLGLSVEELREWRQSERGLTVYQVGRATRPYTRGWAGDTPNQKRRTKDRVALLIEELRRLYGTEFRTAITAKAVQDEVAQLMEIAGVQAPKVLYYSNLRSRADFEDETVGLLIGSIDPGDEHIMTTLALLGLNAEPPEMVKNSGETIRTPGRVFTGPNAEEATEVLEAVREMNVAQAIGRYARDADDLSSRAIVYVYTDAIPPDLVDGVVPGVTDNFINKQRAIIESAGVTDEWLTLLEIQDRIGADSNNGIESVSKQHIRTTLTDLQGRGVTIRRGSGGHGADEFFVESDIPLGAVDLEPLESE